MIYTLSLNYVDNRLKIYSGPYRRDLVSIKTHSFEQNLNHILLKFKCKSIEKSNSKYFNIL